MILATLVTAAGGRYEGLFYVSSQLGLGAQTCGQPFWLCLWRCLLDESNIYIGRRWVKQSAPYLFSYGCSGSSLLFTVFL